MCGLEEIKDLIVPALIAKLAAESLEPLLNLLHKYTDQPELILETLVQASRLRTSIKNAIEEMKIQQGKNPTDGKSWQYRITRTFQKISIKEVEEAVNQALTRQAKIAKSYGLLGNILIVDQKEKPAWHKVHTEGIVSINPRKKPYHKGHRFYTAIIAGKVSVISMYMPDLNNIDKGFVVRQALIRAKKLTEVKRVLIDAGFFKKSVYSAISLEGSDVLGVVPKNSKVIQLIMLHHRALSHHYEPGIYLYRLGDTKFHLLLVPRPKEKRKISSDHNVRRIVKNYISLAVFEVPDGIPDEFRTRGSSGLSGIFRQWAFESAENYRKRGLIEVLLRLESLIEARIGAHYASLRFFVFGLELVLVNIYSLFDGIMRYVLLLSHGLSVKLTVVFVVQWLEKFAVLSFYSCIELHFSAISSRPPPALACL